MGYRIVLKPSFELQGDKMQTEMKMSDDEKTGTETTSSARNERKLGKATETQPLLQMLFCIYPRFGHAGVLQSSLEKHICCPVCCMRKKGVKHNELC